MNAREPGSPDAASRTRRLVPSRVAIASVACGAGGVVLAALGGLGARLGLLGPVAAQGSLVVALGATILGTTLAAVALGVTREDGTAPRSRAWIGAAVNLGLLLALVVVLARGAGRPLVVDVVVGAPSSAGTHAGGEAPMDAAALRRLRAESPHLVPIAIAEPVDVAFARARRTAEALGWEIVERDDRERRLAARAGRAGPDVVIRVHPAPDGAVVAIRPAGEARLEESLARIRAFSERITRS